MMSAVLHRLDRRKVLVISALLTILLMMKISLTGMRISHFFAQSPAVTCKLECSASASVHLDEKFIFPELNKSNVFLKPLIIGRNITESNSFLGEQNAAENIVQSVFRPGLSQEERHIMLALFQVFIRACIQFRISFFLYGGTLLGSMRHHDIIPWDDDIDVILNTSDRSSLQQALSTTGNQFALYAPKNKWWKFYWINTNTLPEKHFRWPYIDIFFFAENKTHIFDESSDYKHAFSFPKHKVFPLSFRPFAGAMLPVPCKLLFIVTNNYTPRLCMSPKFSHKFESEIPEQSKKIVSCKSLDQDYPFVHRRVFGNFVHEDLVKGKTIINTVTLPKKCS